MQIVTDLDAEKLTSWLVEVDPQPVPIDRWPGWWICGKGDDLCCQSDHAGMMKFLNEWQRLWPVNPGEVLAFHKPCICNRPAKWHCEVLDWNYCNTCVPRGFEKWVAIQPVHRTVASVRVLQNFVRSSPHDVKAGLYSNSNEAAGLWERQHPGTPCPAFVWVVELKQEN